MDGLDLFFRDTRNQNPGPSDLRGGVRFDFKKSASIGIPGNEGYYCGSMYYRHWSSGNDWSGGGVTHVAYTDQQPNSTFGNRKTPNMWMRSGYASSGATGTWGPWVKFWHNQNDGMGSGLDADTVHGINGSDLVRGRGYIYHSKPNQRCHSGFYEIHSP